MLLSKEPPCGAGSNGGEIVLLGVRVKVDSMSKSVSMNNHSKYLGEKSGKVVAKEGGGAAGYASADEAVPLPFGGGERKRGIPWTEEEHKLFLIGLQKVGKGDWRGISKNYVKTRTPTQVASHAQKYFLRRTNINRLRRRRSSLFDITTDSVAAMPTEESQPVSQPASVHLPVTSNVTIDPVLSSIQGLNSLEKNYSRILVRHVPVFSLPPSSAMADLNLNLPGPLALSLRPPLPTGQNQLSTPLQVLSSFPNGDSYIRVA